MTFREDHLSDFEEIFKDSKPKLESLPGCMKVELMQDWEDPTVYITYSHWKSKEDLDHYRESEMFKGIWARCKVLFADRPLAFSMKSAII